MNTDSKTPAHITPLEENEPIVIGFPCATKLGINSFVKLGSDGNVTLLDDPADMPLGRVVSNYQNNDDGKLRILTHFSAKIKGKANGIVATGAPVAVTGVESDLPNFAAAGDEEWVTGIALAGGADNAEIWVGVLRVPYLTPAGA